MLAHTITMLALFAPAVRVAEAPIERDPPAKVTVTWKGKTYSPDELPDDLPVKVARAVRSWLAWVEVEGYRMEVEEAGRLVFILRQSKGMAKREPGRGTRSHS